MAPGGSWMCITAKVLQPETARHRVSRAATLPLVTAPLFERAKSFAANEGDPEMTNPAST
jgi:hypothetical protein